MGKSTRAVLEPEEILEEVVEDNPVKSPLRDADPEPEYVPAYQVINGRQDILSDKIPPKIMSLEALIAAGLVNETNLAAYLEDNGYVKNTDYAGTDTGGVVKTSATYGTAISTAGALYGSTRTASQYDNATNALMMCKGTLENIKVYLASSGIAGDFADEVTTPDTTKEYALIMKYDTDNSTWYTTFKALT